MPTSVEVRDTQADAEYVQSAVGLTLTPKDSVTVFVREGDQLTVSWESAMDCVCVAVNVHSSLTEGEGDAEADVEFSSDTLGLVFDDDGVAVLVRSLVAVSEFVDSLEGEGCVAVELKVHVPEPVWVRDAGQSETNGQW